MGHEEVRSLSYGIRIDHLLKLEDELEAAYQANSVYLP